MSEQPGITRKHHHLDLLALTPKHNARKMFLNGMLQVVVIEPPFELGFSLKLWNKPFTPLSCSSGYSRSHFVHGLAAPSPH